MKRFGRMFCFGAAVLGAGLLPASRCTAQPQSPINTSVPPSMIEESDMLVVVGSLVRIDRKASWPRIDMVTTSGESWMLELPTNVTLAWYQGRPQDLDDLKFGQWIKVLYTKANGRKRVRSVQILPGFRDPSAGQGQAGGTEPENPFPKAPEMPTAPYMPANKSPRIPDLPTTKTPQTPDIPAIPMIDTSRQPHH